MRGLLRRRSRRVRDRPRRRAPPTAVRRDRRPAALARRDIGTMRLRARTARTRGPRVRAAARRRVALALENAGRSRARALETRLTTALDSLADAVTIQDAHGAARLRQRRGGAALGFETPSSCWTRRRARSSTPTSPSTRTARRSARAPARPRRAPAGRRSRSWSARSTRTGEERWRVVKATGRRAPGGSLAVNVIEDVTEVKRAEHTQRFLAQAGARAGLLARLRADARPDRAARGAAARRLVHVSAARAATGCAASRVAHVDPAKLELRPRVPGALPDRARRADRRRAGAARRQLAAS